MSRSLAGLLAAVPAPARPEGGGVGVALTGLAVDSRQVKPGMLFAALSGNREDGRRYVEAALRGGATLVLHDAAPPWPELPEGITRLVHPRPRQALAWLAAAWHHFPARKLRCVGVTGTNGKTSSAGMVASILNAAGERCAVLGTTGIFWPGVTRPSAMTTPDALTLQGVLAEMVEDGCTALAMEASSHALDQYRVEGIPFAAGIFTNLTRDHLDYHGTLDAYFRAKARLFLERPLGVAAIHREDPWGRALLEGCAQAGVTTQPWQAQPAPGVVAAREVRPSWEGSRFRLWLGCEERVSPPIMLPAAGGFNVLNALAAAAACHGLGVADAALVAGLNGFVPVPGRMQTLARGQPFAVVVDYAHTPDALERLLATARRLTKGKVILLFGCGGDRDKGKRPLMGEIAGRLADRVIVTDDNPRSEDPAAIRAAILAGVGGAERWELPEREAAIHFAVGQAQAGDAVLLAGKGHETVQITAQGSHPFDDLAIAATALHSLGFGG